MGTGTGTCFSLVPFLVFFRFLGLGSEMDGSVSSPADEGGRTSLSSRCTRRFLDDRARIEDLGEFDGDEEGTFH